MQEAADSEDVDPNRKSVNFTARFWIVSSVAPEYI